MVIRMAALSVDDATDLRAIVNSPESQNCWYMAERLPMVKHRVGQDWWTYLMHQIRNSRGKIGTSLPLTQIQDGLMDSDQKAVFKGYGKTTALNSNQPPIPTNEAFAPSPAARHQYDGSAYDPNTYDLNVVDNNAYVPSAPLSPSIDHKIDMLAQTIAEEGRANRELLTAMIAKLSAPAERERRPRRERADREK